MDDILKLQNVCLTYQSDLFETEAVKDLDVSLYTEAESAHISYPDGLIAKSFEVIKPLAETDFIINLCKLL